MVVSTLFSMMFVVFFLATDQNKAKPDSVKTKTIKNIKHFLDHFCSSFLDLMLLLLLFIGL